MPAQAFMPGKVTPARPSPGRTAEGPAQEHLTTYLEQNYHPLRGRVGAVSVGIPHGGAARLFKRPLRTFADPGAGRRPGSLVAVTVSHPVTVVRSEAPSLDY